MTRNQLRRLAHEEQKAVLRRLGLRRWRRRMLAWVLVVGAVVLLFTIDWRVALAVWLVSIAHELKEH